MTPAARPGRKPPGRETLTVELTRFDPELADVWHGWRNQPTSLRFNPVRDDDVDELRARLAVATTDPSDRSATEYRWLVTVDDEPVGTVGLQDVSWAMGHCELAYQISEEHHGRGYGREAVAKLIDLVFQTTDMRRVIAQIAVSNTASRRLVESLGFQHEGTLRAHFLIQETPVDEAVYGLLRSEWAPHNTER